MPSPRSSRLQVALTALAAVVALAVALVPSVASAETTLNPDNRPTPIEGEENGRIPPEKLVTVVAGCRAVREAGPSLALLFRQARSRGVGLGARDCYRPIDEQVTLYNRNTATGGPCTAQPSYYPDGRRRGTSNHGWGKAVDFSNSGRSMTFSSAGYRFLSNHAEATGWHHPGWAGPGRTCAEPWHWEWVGDGGTDGGPIVRADVVSLLVDASDTGHTIVTGLGAVETHGTARSYGSTAGVPINWVIVDGSATASGAGYWLIGGDGGVFTYGDAGFYGSTGDLRLNAPVVWMAPTPSGEGYWLVAADGGVFSFGDARFFGSLGDRRLNAAVVGMAASPAGGYWLVAADGGVFAFGGAGFHGSTGSIRLNAPVTAMAATASGDGYWLVADDGGVFNFGDARFLGSAAGTRDAPFVDIAAATSGGYWVVAADAHVVRLTP